MKNAEWGIGPWNNEPGPEFRDEFVYRDHVCILKRSMLGCWCGYVRISVNFDDDDIESLEVHGGITYSCYGNPNDWSKEDGYIWIGFDCGHHTDFLPVYSAATARDMIARDMINTINNLPCDAATKELLLEKSHSLKYLSACYSSKNYKTIEFAREQIHKLVDQIKNILKEE